MPKFIHRLNFTIDEDTKRMLKMLCMLSGRSASNLIRFLISQEFERLGFHLEK